MESHIAALLTWAGPGLFSALGFMGFHGARAAFRSFERVVRENTDAHEAIMAQLRKHDMEIASHEMRIDGHMAEHEQIRSRWDAHQAQLIAQGQRIARLEAREQPRQ